jgi:deoxycytidine triphosphate deaminase
MPTQIPLLVPESRWLAPTLPDPNEFNGVRRLCVDVEVKDEQLDLMGPGVRRPGNFVVGLALGADDGRRWYFPFSHEDPRDNMDRRLVMRWARDVLNKLRVDVVGAHLLYDLDWLANDGITFAAARYFFDVQNAEPLLDENRLSFSLETLSQDYLGEGKDEELLKEAAVSWGFHKKPKDLKKNLWRLPGRYVGPYAEADVDRPLRILEMQEKRLHEEGLWDLFIMESRLIPLLLAMRRRGVRVDIEQAQRVRERLVQEREKWLKVIRQHAGAGADLMDKDRLGRALEARGIQVPRTLKRGDYSIKKELLALHKNDELCHAIREGRKVNTIITTFLDGHILGHHVNGRIHCEFNQLKSDTEVGDDIKGTIARFSSSNPNLQNVPARDEELAPLIRGMFLPEEGELWHRKDYNQIEYRFLAHFAKGKGADECRAQYNKDPKTDYHKLCARLANMDELDTFIRKLVKNINFGKVYGAGPDKLAATMGKSKEEAIAFTEKYDEDLPFVKETFDTASEIAQHYGYVRTILKRRQRFPFWEPKKWHGGERPPGLPYEQAIEQYGGHSRETGKPLRQHWRLRRAYTHAALNRVLQGSAADMMKKAMVEIWESGVCDIIGAPLLTVHDELDDSVPQTPAGREAAAEATRLMQNAIQLRVPVLVDADYGANWYRTLCERLVEFVGHYDTSLVNPASIDIRLGETILIEDPDSDNMRPVQLKGRSERYMLAPGQFVLASTLERIRVPIDMALELKLKSSIARGRYNHSLAFWFDPGWDGIGTLELMNVSQFRYRPLEYGMRIGQIIYHTLDEPCAKPYAGKYQGATTVEAAKP